MDLLKIANEWLEASKPEVQAMVKILIEDAKVKNSFEIEEFWRKQIKPTKWERFEEYLQIGFVILGCLALISIFGIGLIHS